MSSQFDVLSATFQQWLAAVDEALADVYETRDKLPYQLHQWWELWDHVVSPDNAATAAILLAPGCNAPRPDHAAYNERNAQ